MRNSGKIAIGAALAMAVLAARHPTADIQLITHDLGDPAPHRMRAAVDFGLMGVSVLYTWSKHLG